MEIDPGNKVVQLCTEGMSAEFEGKLEESESLFSQAWELAENDFEAFMAAHYMARRQKSAEDKLKWNLESYHLAKKIEGDGMTKYMPSLCLNVGKSYEDLGNFGEAGKYYQSGADYADSLTDNSYGSMIKSGLNEGLKRVGISKNQNPVLNSLINKWCANRNLKALSFILPSYVTNLGSEPDNGRIQSALSYLSAARFLNDEEQQIVDKLIVDFNSFS
jgi:tetratricopeptide (TPR) repeat protein